VPILGLRIALETLKIFKIAHAVSDSMCMGEISDLRNFNPPWRTKGTGSGKLAVNFASGWRGDPKYAKKFNFLMKKFTYILTLKGIFAKSTVLPVIGPKHFRSLSATINISISISKSCICSSPELQFHNPKLSSIPNRNIDFNSRITVPPLHEKKKKKKKREKGVGWVTTTKDEPSAIKMGL
jgi:hypothetical protein